MFNWMLFFHIVGVAFWLGATVAVFIIQRHARAVASDSVNTLLRNTMRTVVHGIINPSSLIVLFSGVFMILQMNLSTKPFWLAFMEMFGGMLVLVSVVLLTWQLRKATKALSEKDQSAFLSRLTHSMTGVGVGVIAIILVVALRLA